MSRGAVRNWRQGVQAPKTPHPRGRRAGRCLHPGGGSALTACRSPSPEAQSGRPKVWPSRLSEDSCQRPVPGSCLSPGARDGRASGFRRRPCCPAQARPWFSLCASFHSLKKASEEQWLCPAPGCWYPRAWSLLATFLTFPGATYREPCLNSERG